MEVSHVQDFEAKVTAIAEYDYLSKEDDEIDLQKGHIIQNIIQKSGGWWEGTNSSTGKRGMFPDNFVRVIEKAEPSSVILRDKSSTVQRRCKAIFSYTQVKDDELSLAVGDIIEFLAEVEEGWWRGKLNNKIGVFPSNFVVSIPSSPVTSSQRHYSQENLDGLKTKTKTTNRNQNCFDEVAFSTKTKEVAFDDYRASKQVKEFCRVEFPYSPQNDDELELTVGQIITIVDKELPDKGWWKGEVNGKIGVFPDNFVKLLPMDVKILNCNQTSLTESATKEITKQSKTSIIPPLSPPKGFESKSLHDEVSSKTNIKAAHMAAQGKSTENLNIELNTHSTSNERINKNAASKAEESKRKSEHFEDKKTPPPIPNKKPLIPVKKTITNVAGSMVSSLRQKVKSVDQRLTLSQDVNDSNSSKLINERTCSFDETLAGDVEFDKVQRTSILSDMRANRVKAPKRRPPSVVNSSMTDSFINNMNFVNKTEKVCQETESIIRNEESSSNIKQIKPKHSDWGTQKVPWMDELKANQSKIKSLPCIEPRTTLVNTNNENNSNGEIITTSVSTNIKTEVDGSFSKESFDSETSCSVYISSSIKQNIEDENFIRKPTSYSSIHKERLSEQFKILDETSTSESSESLQSKMKTKLSSPNAVIQSNEPTNTSVQEGTTIIELEKRVKKLEINSQIQLELIEELRKLLQIETNRVELLKNQLDKYAQCYTHL